MLTTFVSILLDYLREVTEVVLVGFVVAGVINAVVNKEAIVRYLGHNLFVSNLLGATIGVVTPLCCCSAIPTALTLYRAGSRRGPACAFLIATPWFNWYGLTALAIFLGMRVTLAIAASAVLIAFVTGVVIDLVIPRDPPKASLAMRVDPTPCACGDSCCTTKASTAAGLFDFSDPGGKLREGVRFAVDLVREVGPWIVGGVVLGAAVQAFVPEHVFTQYLGGASILGLLAALLVAGIFSADSLGTLPWVQSLLSKGLGPGSAMVLLVAGVGTNLSTLGPVARLMGRKTAVLYGASVVVLTGSLGLGLNLTL
ncbi:MAG: permease [Dehalococcoidia bacterium]